MTAESVWVLVAESARARLFRLQGQTLEELEDFTNPRSRTRSRDINADKGGRSFDSAGQGRHAMEKSKDPHRVEVREFAQRLTDRLERGRAAGEFGRLILIAPPLFLGELRHCLGKALQALVRLSISKNLVQAAPEEIGAYLKRPVR